MANINKIRLSGQTYNIEDASLKGDIYVTSENRNSVQSVIKEGLYSLSTDDIYSITGSKANSTDRIIGFIIVDGTSYNFTGSTSSDVEGVSALNGVVTFDLSSVFTISLVDRDTNKIDELFIESFTTNGDESPMSNVTITHNPAIGTNKVDYIASLYTEFVHEKYALVKDLETKQDTLVSGTNIKTINNQSILGSGNITIQGGSGASVIEATQAEYDDAASAGTLDLTALYIITDAQSLDIRDYWTSAQTESAISQATSGKANSSDVYLKTETSGATEISTALNAKQDTLVSGTNIKTINNESILGSGNITIEGGGKAIEAGRGISITTGETADTVSFNLPISAGTGSDSIIVGYSGNTATKSYSIALGSFNKASGDSSMAVNDYNVAGGQWSFAGGEGTKALGTASTSFGYNTNANNNYSFAVGRYNNANNVASFACGACNISSSASTTFGHSGNTLFSVGNGYNNRNRHNAFEIRENGDIYIADTNDTETTHEYEKPMIKLQDSIGGTSYSAGTGIDITNDVISVTGKQDTLISGTNIKTINNESILGSGNISIQGGVIIDPSLDSGSTNPVANSAITKTLYTAANANGDGNGYVGNIEAKDDTTYLDRLIWGFTATRYKRPLGGSNSNNTQGVSFYCSSINGVRTVSNNYQNVGHFSLVETSAITTSVTSSSTDAQVPSAKAVNDKLGGLSIVKLTESEYAALVTKDSNTLYCVIPDPSN